MHDNNVKNLFIQRQGSFSELELAKKKKKFTLHKSFDLKSCNITKTTITNFKKNKKAFRTLLLGFLILNFYLKIIKIFTI